MGAPFLLVLRLQPQGCVALPSTPLAAVLLLPPLVTLPTPSRPSPPHPQDKKLARRVQQLFAAPSMRVNTTNDVIGVEVCGALKNVLAIAAGIVEGLDLGHNAMAALISQVRRPVGVACVCGGSLCSQPPGRCRCLRHQAVYTC